MLGPENQRGRILNSWYAENVHTYWVIYCPVRSFDGGSLKGGTRMCKKIDVLSPSEAVSKAKYSLEFWTMLLNLPQTFEEERSRNLQSFLPIRKPWPSKLVLEKKRLNHVYLWWSVPTLKLFCRSTEPLNPTIVWSNQLRRMARKNH